MTNDRMRESGRRHLDSRFSFNISPQDENLVQSLARPQKGWVKAIREALGMTTNQLARRVGVSQPAITFIENSEVLETVKLATLERVAAALNCRLVYALVPNEPLETMVQKRAHEVAESVLGGVEHTMRLENQAVDSAAVRERQISIIMSDLDMRRLWD